MTNISTYNNGASKAYRSLEEIRIRKALLQKDILKDKSKIEQQWHSLFQRPDALKSNATPSKRFSSLFNTGASLLDAFVLGLKLYRKFKK